MPQSAPEIEKKQTVRTCGARSVLRTKLIDCEKGNNAHAPAMHLSNHEKARKTTLMHLQCTSPTTRKLGKQR